MKSKTTSILLSVVIALGLWLYVITVENPNQVSPYYNVKVVLEGENVLTQKGLMLTSDPDIRVRVDLKSNRTNLSNINSDNLTIKADLADIDEPGTHELSYDIVFPGNVSASDVKVVNRQPGTVQVTVAERAHKEIPVLVSFKGKVRENFIMQATQMKLDSETVTVDGPKEVVDQIDHASIVIDCTDRTETISESYRYTLENSSNEAVDAAMIKTNVEKIRVEVPIVATKKIPLRFNINPGGGAQIGDCQIEILDSDHITVCGSDTALDKLDEIVLGTLNLEDIAEDTERAYPITLPEGITNLSGVNEVTVKITFPQLDKKEFTITDIQPINVPAGKIAEVITKQLVLTVRGPARDLQKLTINDITVQVDLSDVDSIAEVEPIVTFSGSFSHLGVVGKYSISASVSDAPEATAE